MIKFFCDKCGKEVPDLKEAVNIQYAEKRTITQDGKFNSVYIEVKKLLCEECKKEITKLFK